MHFNNTRGKLKFTKNDITFKRFRYIECLISNNVKLFRLKLYFRLTTYTVIDLSDGDRWLGNFKAVPCMKKKNFIVQIEIRDIIMSVLLVNKN